MKVYVDELPERCLDCCLLSDGNFCNHDDFVGELHSVNVYKEKPKNCPLQSLADHDKQVRNEVCEILDKKIHNYLSNKCRSRESLDIHSIIKQQMKGERNE